ncbi:uncharacterized protein LOC131307612 [Rhododendron vialii]|uniref:uncharacterized protein LOC131307612 n=1 Tax=Rhododendron vialii TaxID=182163 RepID=UPI00265EE494|nr:uncharacterized protein LOC131307612 [Rhododendron vialii]
MTEQVASTLMFCDTAREVWTQAQELYSGVDNLRRTYDLHQSFFNISQGDDSFEDYYAKFRRICNELDICEPLTADIQVIRRHRERMRVTRFLSGASSTFGLVGNQILGNRDLPPLSEVFSRLRQSSSISAPTSGRSALSSAISDSSALSVSHGRGRSRDSGFSSRGRDYGVSGRGFGGRDSGFGGRGRDSGGRSFGRGRGFGGRDSGFDNRGGRTSGGVAAVAAVIQDFALIVGEQIIRWSSVIIFTAFPRLIRLLSLRILNSLLHPLPMWLFQLRSTNVFCHFRLRQDPLLLRSLRPVHPLLVLPHLLPFLGLLTQEPQII